ncbi:TPA: YkvA family protein [Vibrio alginolyticus]|uniref:YkvA family protein n=1 Tax=Vibrio sp. PBL-C16 TaxID=3104322 RepID=UPI002AB56F76|nr:YkvA family protein [Vibrio sp. PBL-C16]MDY8147912.1 YkvA family protein [Vibrio sp. PBL-C16]
MTTTMSVKSAPKDAKDQTMQAPDEKNFWRKMKGSVKKAGEEIAVMGIKSWLAMADSNTSVRHKAILGGALAYFVLPTDMVPDVLAGVGFTDDMAALTLAANSVGNAITKEHEAQAREKLNSMAD